MVGCRWDDPVLEFEIPDGAKSLSERDSGSGSYQEMVQSYESFLAHHRAAVVNAKADSRGSDWITPRGVTNNRFEVGRSTFRPD